MLQILFNVFVFCYRKSIHTKTIQELIYCDALFSFSYFSQHNYELPADVWRCTYNIYPPHNPVIGARLVSQKIILHKLVFISDSLFVNWLKHHFSTVDSNGFQSIKQWSRSSPETVDRHMINFQTVSPKPFSRDMIAQMDINTAGQETHQHHSWVS